MKDSWEPTWCREDRRPSYIGRDDGAPLKQFGTNKYLWGNMPALDVLKINDNEGELGIVTRNLALLFAASGDLRNVVTTLAKLPQTYEGELCFVLNDRDFIVVARNTIMLMTALLFDPKDAVPMIIHLWYSAALPRVMVDALRSNVQVTVNDVCSKIKDKPAGSM